MFVLECLYNIIMMLASVMFLVGRNASPYGIFDMLLFQVWRCGSNLARFCMYVDCRCTWAVVTRVICFSHPIQLHPSVVQFIVGHCITVSWSGVRGWQGRQMALGWTNLPRQTGYVSMSHMAVVAPVATGCCCCVL